MSRLWQDFLVIIRTLGNNSGCHQMADHSFFYKGKQFPVCARCTGVFIGQVLAIIFMSIAFVVNPIISISILLIMGADWFVQYIGLLESTNTRRLITGLLGGFGLFNIYGFVVLIFIRIIFK